MNNNRQLTLAQFVEGNSMKLPIAASLAGLLIASGCAEQKLAQFQRQRDQAQADLINYNTACKAEWPRVAGNFVARAKCFDDAFARVDCPRLGCYPDLIQLFSAARMSLSVKADRGEVTPEDERQSYTCQTLAQDVGCGSAAYEAQR